MTPASLPDLVMINLGSGLQHAPGWVNYDRSRAVFIARSRLLRATVRFAHAAGVTSRSVPLRWPRETRVHDVTKGLPHQSASVDIVYSSHFLEHLTRDAANELLHEIFRVLRPQGWIRLVVPDIQTLARAYVTGDRDYFQNDEPTIADAFLESLKMRHAQPRGRPFERFARRLLMTDEGGHRWMYDADSLAYRMRESGFVDIETVAFQEGRCNAAAALDSRPRGSLYIEGRKP
jgi:predicted SAM-dependent methyltransferase